MASLGINSVNDLPREFKGDLNARVWIDDSGQFNIEFSGGGGFSIPEDIVYSLWDTFQDEEQ